jgi:putative endonuclease
VKRAGSGAPADGPGADAGWVEHSTARWFVYVVRCRDGTLYTGCTTDLARRLAAHNAGRGARYTRARRPVTLVYFVRVRGRARALSREARLKQMTRAEKLAVIAAARHPRKAGLEALPPRGHNPRRHG